LGRGLLGVSCSSLLFGQRKGVHLPVEKPQGLLRRFARNDGESVGLLRAFGPRNDEQKGSLRASFVRPPFVTASLALSPGEAVSGIPRRFAARNDWRRGVRITKEKGLGRTKGERLEMTEKERLGRTEKVSLRARSLVCEAVSKALQNYGVASGFQPSQRQGGKSLRTRFSAWRSNLVFFGSETASLRSQ